MRIRSFYPIQGTRFFWFLILVRFQNRVFFLVTLFFFRIAFRCNLGCTWVIIFFLLIFLVTLFFSGCIWMIFRLYLDEFFFRLGCIQVILFGRGCIQVITKLYSDYIFGYIVQNQQFWKKMPIFWKKKIVFEFFSEIVFLIFDKNVFFCVFIFKKNTIFFFFFWIEKNTNFFLILKKKKKKLWFWYHPFGKSSRCHLDCI